MSECEHPYYYLLNRCKDRLAKSSELRAKRPNDNDLVFDGLRSGSTLEDIYDIVARAHFESAGRIVLEHLNFDICVQGEG